MPQVFISHSSKDLEVVLTRLKPLLDELGMAAWCSATDIRMAADWERQIRAALARADWFLVVMSPAAQASEWVQAETHWALEHLRGRVIPVMVGDCIPEHIHLRLGTLQYVDFRQDPRAAAGRLRALLGAGAADSVTRLGDPGADAGPSDLTVLTERLAGEVLLAIEPDLGPPYEQRLPIRRCATIGRMEGVELRLPDACVSRRHAKLCLDRGAAGQVLTLTDLDSANGTHVNGERLLTSRPLAVGDLLEIGKVRILVRDIALPP